MTTEETATVEFSMTYANRVYTSSYVAGYETFLLGIHGAIDERRILNGSLHRNDPATAERYEKLSQ
ncbi:MAG: hypothetical protein ABEI86_01905, partial [Halobacteriaceae archaeon]